MCFFLGQSVGDFKAVYGFMLLFIFSLSATVFGMYIFVTCLNRTIIWERTVIRIGGIVIFSTSSYILSLFVLALINSI